MKDCYSAGDRVASNVQGYYYGLPGTLIEPAQWQYGRFRRFVVELDCGICLVLPADQMKKLKSERGRG